MPVILFGIGVYFAVGILTLFFDLDSASNYNKPFLSYLLFWPITLCKAIYRAFIHAVVE